MTTPLYADLSRIIPGAIIREDENGAEYIPAKYGRVVAVNPDDANNYYFAAVFTNLNGARWRRFWKCNPTIAWREKDESGETVEIAALLEYGKCNKLLHVLKPLMKNGSTYQPLKRKRKARFS